VTPRPEYVLIGPHRFEIRWSHREMTRHSRNAGEDRFAQTEIGEQIITISDDRPLSGTQESLVHEILHALIWEACIAVPENPEADHDEREEKLVGQLSGVVLDCLKRNPHVWAWVTADAEE
jgi:hypothetical protein